MSELKTKPNNASVLDFINSVDDESKRKDSLELLKIFEEITGEKAKMWGTSIIGFGMYHYKSERSKQEGDWPLVGFSPRKQNFTLYVMSPGFEVEQKENFNKLGKYKTSVGCLYINKLDNVNISILKDLIKEAYKKAKKQLVN